MGAGLGDLRHGGEVKVARVLRVKCDTTSNVGWYEGSDQTAQAGCADRGVVACSKTSISNESVSAEYSSERWKGGGQAGQYLIRILGQQHAEPAGSCHRDLSHTACMRTRAAMICLITTVGESESNACTRHACGKADCGLIGPVSQRQASITFQQCLDHLEQHAVMHELHAL